MESNNGVDDGGRPSNYLVLPSVPLHCWLGDRKDI